MFSAEVDDKGSFNV